MTPEIDIYALLGDEPANREHLPLLEAQFSTRAGVVPFVGAGLSASFGFPQWGAFLSELAIAGGTVDRTARRLAAAQYEEAASDLLEALGPRRFQDMLAARFGDHVIDSRRIDGAVAELRNLPPGPIITTNFDRVIETAFAQGHRKLTPYWHSYASKGSEALQQDKPFLLKLHGDWDDPAGRVLTLDEYQAAYGDQSGTAISFGLPVPALLFKLLTSRCCLFLGCSLRQDRTIHLLRSVARGIPDLVHYAIVERPQTDDEYRRRAAELSTQSIRPVWYPHGRHDLLQPVLGYLARRAAEGLRRLAESLAPIASTRAAVPNNLPDLGNVTIGRASEVRQIRDMARVARLITITGVGGCGKSRLVIEVASAIAGQYERGVWFVPLGDLARKADREGVVPSRIGKILGVVEQVGRPPHESLAEHLASGRYLLVLDNCEHLIASCRSLTSYLLSRCPDLTILATSRRPLKIPQERLYPLAPLATPDDGASVEEILRNESVRLFVERARQRSPSWELQEPQARHVAAVCRALAGIPLAIEVAAARLGVQTVEGMAAHSRDLLSALGNSRSGDLRSWTLKAALRWSYGLLRGPQQRFMRALTVFDGGWSAEAAAAVFDVHSETAEVDPAKVSETLDLLQELHEHSLVVSSEINGAKRFRYLEPIRQVVQLEIEADESADYERRHARFFIGRAEVAAPHILQHDQAEWLDALQLEVDNLRRAIRWSIATGDALSGLRLIAALWRFTEIRGYLSEGRMRAREVLAIPGVEQHAGMLSKVLSGAGILAYRQADFDDAQEQFARSLEIEEALHNDAGIANALNDLGIVASIRGDFTRARDLYDKSLAIERRRGNERGVAVALFNLGSVSYRIGDDAEAERLLLDSLRAFRDQGNERESAFPLNGLAELFVTTGQLGAAHEYGEASLAIREKLKDTKGIADSLRTVGRVALEERDFAAAREHLARSVGLSRSVGDRRGVMETLDVLAALGLHEGRAVRAIELFAAADQIRRSLNYTPPQSRILRRETLLADARAAVSADAYESAWRRGTALSFDEVVNAAVKDLTVGI